MPMGRSTWAVLLLVAASHGFASENADPDTKPSEKANPQPDRSERVCKRITVTGSHFRQRVCMRRDEWEAQSKSAEEKMRYMREVPAPDPTQ